uniref:Uncharacterized protein n=1 Tax=Trypanosoma vivax (strain Y486) TaxID=1055687 RepID=G0U133_TRYVY|nr:hypothetical protein TVY486_0803960 [Trypanosoma vivax Y486]
MCTRMGMRASRSSTFFSLRLFITAFLCSVGHRCLVSLRLFLWCPRTWPVALAVYRPSKQPKRTAVKSHALFRLSIKTEDNGFTLPRLFVYSHSFLLLLFLIPYTLSIPLGIYHTF